jgi:MFS family permease
MTISRRPILALAAADTISLTGTRLSMVAIPWLVLTMTGDPVLTGLAGLAEMLPYVLAKALCGPLVDRLGARRIAITADLASMAAIALIPLLHFAGLLSIATILPIVALLGVARGPADGAKYSMVPAVAAIGGVPLERVTGIMGVIERLASTLGAAAAGALVALLGPAVALSLTAAAFGASALTIAFALRSMTRPEGREQAGYLTDLREGWRWFHRDAVLVGIVVMIAATNFLDAAYGTVLVPVWSEAFGNAALLGLLFAVFSGASIAGSAVATMLAERLPRLTVYVVAFLLTGAPRFVVFAFEVPLAAIFAVLVVGGFASGFLNPILSAVMLERIPAALIGRVTALTNAHSWALIPLGGVAAGALVTLVGLPATFAVMGIAYFAVTLAPLAVRGFREFAQRPRVPA